MGLGGAGIFRPVSLIGVTKARIDSVYIRQEHRDTDVTLHVQVLRNTGEIGAAGEDAAAEEFGYDVEIMSPDGILLRYPDSPSEIRIESPKLWWPNGYGEQPLYRVEALLVSVQGACGGAGENPRWDADGEDSGNPGQGRSCKEGGGETGKRRTEAGTEGKNQAEDKWNVKKIHTQNRTER